jgi:uncharacterized protein (DUF302 family)
MRTVFSAITLLFMTATTLHAAQGMVSLKSSFDVATTADRLEESLKKKGMTLFARIDHGDAAAKAGLELGQMELMIFGNPKVGTKLMQCAASVGIDLPQKALIWRDTAGQVWFSYNSPQYLASRHELKGCDEVIGKVSKALENFARSATAP